MKINPQKLAIIAIILALSAFALPAATEQIYNFIETENINVTQDEYNVTITVNLSNKVNKTGDNMTGGLNVAGNITATGLYAKLMGVNLPNYTDGTIDDSILASSFYGLPAGDTTNQFTVNLINNNPNYLPTILLRHASGSWDGVNADPSATLNAFQLGSITVAGFDGNAWTGTKSALQWFSDGDWNATSSPVYLRFQTFGLAGAHRWFMREGVFYPNGNLTQDLGKNTNQFGHVYAKNATLSGLSGTGNDYACLDSAGTLYRSNTAC